MKISPLVHPSTREEATAGASYLFKQTEARRDQLARGRCRKVSGIRQLAAVNKALSLSLGGCGGRSGGWGRSRLPSCTLQPRPQEGSECHLCRWHHKPRLAREPASGADQEGTFMRRCPLVPSRGGSWSLPLADI